jgi:hypothetical protein
MALLHILSLYIKLQQFAYNKLIMCRGRPALIAQGFPKFDGCSATAEGDSWRFGCRPENRGRLMGSALFKV